LALKLAGVSAEEPCLRRARTFILANGGIGKANVLTKIWLALFGQFDWQGTPTVPPEVILLPSWFYLNIYEFASWSRATIVALSLVLTLKPVCPVPEGAGVSEIYVEPEGQRRYPLSQAGGGPGWRRLFLLLDSLLKLYERLPVKPGRRKALHRTVEWILAHQEADGSWGGIMLPWVYALIGLKTLGYAPDHPALSRGLQGLEGFIAEDDATLRLQPATSPVWDTAWAVLALRQSGLPADHPALRKAGRWLLGQEIRTGGDWQVKNPKTGPGCWAFEFENDLYPDLDDTAVVARALRQLHLPEEGEKAAAIERAARWVVSMQCRDGGWAAFDRDNDRRILSHVPFADFMTPLDPTCADVTAHVVEFLAEARAGAPALARAVAYLHRTQEPDGAWYGRWGVNYLYGTALALVGLRVAGEPGDRPHVRRAASWLKAHQNPDGGWGESCRTYDDPGLRGCGLSTASQTAWAVLGLIAAGAPLSEVTQRGVEYLLQTQQTDGAWQEEAYTGTGFPRAFYLRYDLYRAYFPLLALARYETCLAEALA
jgi:squalene-hopene/tetraprenyl-beta-curcumene cyclase